MNEMEMLAHNFSSIYMFKQQKEATFSAFLAGFRAAREMAYVKIQNNTNSPIYIRDFYNLGERNVEIIGESNEPA